MPDFLLEIDVPIGDPDPHGEEIEKGQFLVRGIEPREWGIRTDGSAYYDENGADPGEQSAMVIDRNGQLSLIPASEL